LSPKAVAILKNLRPEEYNVTVISPDNFNLFTPLLPSACVGTVEARTLVEPLRKIIARVKGHYMSGKAVDVEMGEKLLEVEVAKDENGHTQRCYVPYDKLVIAVGSSTSTHGVPGLEHCFQLKSIPDAQAIRRRIMTNLELASLPTTTPEERKRLLSMVIAGGGPTGVEVAAEIADMMSEDVLKYFPKLLRSEMSIKIIQSREHILNTYSQSISEFAEKRFARSDIEIIKNARVSEVFPDKIAITVKSDPKDPNGKVEKREYPAGFVLWSTGIAMNPFVKTLVEKLPNQHHSKAIVVDNHLRVKGSPLGTVYCVGDSATVSTTRDSSVLGSSHLCRSRRTWSTTW
jgi:NADH dehydrogenase FAD-containing subunit